MASLGLRPYLESIASSLDRYDQSFASGGTGMLELTLGLGYLKGSYVSLLALLMVLGALTEQWILQAEQSVFLSGCHDVAVMDDTERLFRSCRVVADNRERHTPKRLGDGLFGASIRATLRYQLSAPTMSS